MIINHNMSAMFAQRSQGIQDLNQQKSMEKLSSGLRINRAVVYSDCLHHMICGILYSGLSGVWCRRITEDDYGIWL